MGAIAAPLAAASMGAQAGLTLLGAHAANATAKGQADATTRAADRTRSAAFGEARRKREETDLVTSRQRALTAASGGGTDDATVIDIMADTQAEGDLQAGSIMARGDADAADLLTQAKGQRRAGRGALIGGYASAAGSLAMAGATLYSRYGGQHRSDPVTGERLSWLHNPRISGPRWEL
jgi:hypothetical protein